MNQEEFECWLMSLDDFIDELEIHEPGFGIEMDYSPESLSKLEQRILARFSSVEEIMSNKEYINSCACYIGEVFRKNLGGKWGIELEDTKYAFFNIPTVTIPKAGTDCPPTLVTACVDRRKGDYIETIYNVKKRRISA